MKRFTFYFLFRCLIGVALATSTPPVSLEVRVKSADHVFIGIATGFQLLDQSGSRPVSTPDTKQIGLTYYITVRPVEVLKSTLQTLPPSLIVTNSHQMLVTPESERERFIGKKLVYFLSGTNFVPVNAYQFTEALDSLTNITRLIQSEKK